MNVNHRLADKIDGEAVIYYVTEAGFFFINLCND